METAGLKEIDGVPYLEILANAGKVAEMWAEMMKIRKNLAFPIISRRDTFKNPPKQMIENTEKRFPYHGSGWIKW